MGTNETYNARVDYQEYLDELFPKGAWITVLDQVDGRLLPVGVELTTGRLFCSAAREVDGAWEYQVFVDPRPADPGVQEFIQPFTFWVVEMDLEDDRFAEAQIVPPDPESTQIQVVRIVGDPQGPRRPQRGQRAFITDLRESEMFPRGLGRVA